MTDEISIGIRVNVDSGYLSDAFARAFTDDFPTNCIGGGIQVIGTTPEDIDFGDVLNSGWLYMVNLDETNIVDYGPDSSGTMVSCGRLDPGEACLWRTKPGVTIKACARTAACRLLVKCLDTATST